MQSLATMPPEGMVGLIKQPVLVCGSYVGTQVIDPNDFSIAAFRGTLREVFAQPFHCCPSSSFFGSLGDAGSSRLTAKYAPFGLC